MVVVSDFEQALLDKLSAIERRLEALENRVTVHDRHVAAKAAAKGVSWTAVAAVVLEAAKAALDEVPPSPPEPPQLPKVSPQHIPSEF